jgi:ArsR family transcriptional regulator, arsenate/arsenite/antimonite-responsive transcriptional repressor
MVVNMLFGMKRAVDPDVRLLQAAADPTRLLILRQLSGSASVCACDFTACCDVAQPTVSHHLKVLREAGWVTAERRGNWVFYALNTDAAARFAAIANDVLPTPGASRLPMMAATPAGRRRALAVIETPDPA